MATPNQIGAAIAEIKARTGWTWAEVADTLGTTPTYARKLAAGSGKFGREGAGRGLAGNVQDFQRTGTHQPPVQRPQRVRQAAGAPSAPAAPRVRSKSMRAFKVERSVFRGTGRDGWAVNVTVPTRKGPAGDREDARHAIMDATRRAAQGRRRVAFYVTTKDGRRVELGGRGGYDASRALRGMNMEGRDPLEWLAGQSAGNASTGGSWGEFEAGDVLAVEVVGLP